MCMFCRLFTYLLILVHFTSLCLLFCARSFALLLLCFTTCRHILLYYHNMLPHRHAKKTEKIQTTTKSNNINRTQKTTTTQKDTNKKNT